MDAEAKRLSIGRLKAKSEARRKQLTHNLGLSSSEEVNVHWLRLYPLFDSIWIYSLTQYLIHFDSYFYLLIYSDFGSYFHSDYN